MTAWVIAALPDSMPDTWTVRKTFQVVGAIVTAAPAVAVAGEPLSGVTVTWVDGLE